MIPAFPMDGGRVLRALLAMRLDYVRATQVAASIGQGLAFLFGFWGLFNNPFMLFIALFVWMGAGQEASMVQVRYALDGIPVTRAMLTDYQVLSPEDTLGEMARQMLAGIQQDFPVVQDGKMLGVVTRRDFLAALTARGDCVPVSEVMRSGAPEVDSHDMLEKALARLQESGVPMVPVVHAGELVGILTSENITEFLMIRSARRAAPPAVQGGPCAEPG
jgi:CBS domain-containing protein